MIQKTSRDIDLSDVLDAFRKNIFMDFNCHAIAVIEKFDKDDQTVTAKMAYKKTFKERVSQNDATKPLNNTYKDVLVDYPLLIDCPAIVLQGGDIALKMPIKKGDECLILFNDRSIDDWFESGQGRGVKSLRLHSFSDGIALVGLRNSSRPLTDFDDKQAILGDDTSEVRVGDSKASIEAGDTKVEASDKVLIENASENLNSILQELITQISAITVLCASPGNPSGVPVNAAAITAIGTKIGALLK